MVPPISTFATPLSVPGEKKQLFSVSIDIEMLHFLYETLRNAGLDPAKLDARPVLRPNFAGSATPRQVSVVSPAVEQSFTPSYQTAIMSSFDGQQWQLNSDFFATPETAQFIANKYGNG